MKMTGQSWVRRVAATAVLGAAAWHFAGFQGVSDFSTRDYGTLQLAGFFVANEKPPVVDWRTLRGLNYRTGEIAPTLKKHEGNVVRVPGFMLPLDDDSESVTEFLLVPFVGACVHVPPPPPNQIVYVKMSGEKKIKVEWWDPIWVEGKLEITPTKSAYTDVGFKITATDISPYKE
jgi:hypothetical protein